MVIYFIIKKTFEEGGAMSLLSSLFGSKEVEKENLEKIERLEQKILGKEKEIERLILELETVNNSTKIKPRQLEIFEKNVKDSREEINRLNSVLKSFGIPSKKQYYKYKVELSKLYSASRFREVLDFLLAKGYIFISDVPFSSLQDEIIILKNGEEALKRHSDYLQDNYDWEIATYRNKGEKLIKIFGRGKKLTQFFSEYYLEYMDDLDRIDLNILAQYGCDAELIQEVKEKREQYYLEQREQ
ncbi:hypothetical protein HMPREF3206_00331 [Fusobacterium equinum]|nr:hypothetical protein HMPREF3206_00331 [Fusobacterium equinum]